jgi:hypothetical protein
VEIHNFSIFKYNNKKEEKKKEFTSGTYNGNSKYVNLYND